jgi:hypothetical protein
MNKVKFMFFMKFDIRNVAINTIEGTLSPKVIDIKHGLQDGKYNGTIIREDVTEYDLEMHCFKDGM